MSGVVAHAAAEKGEEMEAVAELPRGRKWRRRVRRREEEARGGDDGAGPSDLIRRCRGAGWRGEMDAVGWGSGGGRERGCGLGNGLRRGENGPGL